MSGDHNANQKPFSYGQLMKATTQNFGTGPKSSDCYGDGTIYRGEQSEDSEVPTLDVQSTMEMWKRAYEAVCDERDAIVKDADKAYELLRWAETEMRYAGWDVRINDQQGRTDVYESIVEFLK